MRRWLIATLAVLLATVALARSEGIYNPSSNAVGDYQGIDSNKPASGSTLACSYSPVTTGTQSVAYTGATPAASGGTPAYTFSETGALPTGLTINTANGVISGTPSVSGTFAGIQVAVADTIPNSVNCGSPFTLVISAPAFQGGGDVFTTSPYAAYSCSEAFTAAFANTNGAMCQFSGVTAGAVTGTCDLKSATNGRADTTTANCVGNTVSIVTFCTVTNTSCSVSKSYDQTGNTRDAVNATLASMPTITFNSSPTGTLPAINCSGGTNAFLQTAATFTQAQPLTSFAVYDRNSTVQAGGIIGANATNTFLGAGSAANTASILAPSGLASGATATDNAWNAVGTLTNGASSAINVNGGTETTGNPGTNGLSANNIRLCRAGAAQFLGLLSEAMIWAAASTNADRNNLNTNAHSSGRYNF